MVDLYDVARLVLRGTGSEIHIFLFRIAAGIHDGRLVFGAHCADLNRCVVDECLVSLDANMRTM